MILPKGIREQDTIKWTFSDRSFIAGQPYVIGQTLFVALDDSEPFNENTFTWTGVWQCNKPINEVWQQGNRLHFIGNGLFSINTSNAIKKYCALAYRDASTEVDTGAFLMVPRNYRL